MIIGKSRIGIGRIGMVGEGTSDLSIFAGMSIMEQRLLSAYTGMSIVDVYTLYALANMDIDAYHHRGVLATMSILGYIPLPVFANMSISENLSPSVFASMNIVGVSVLAALANMSILGTLTPSVLANMSICGPANRTILANMSIADRIILSAYATMSISDAIALETECNFNIANLFACTARTGMDIIDNRYWAIGPVGELIDLSGRVYEPDSNGFGLKTSAQRIAGGRRVDLKDDGIEGAERKFTIIFSNDTQLQEFQEVVNNDSEDLLLFCGRSDRYHLVKKVSVEPDYDEFWRGQAALKVICKMEDPNFYHFMDQGVDLGAASLPLTSMSAYNYGTIAAPICFRIGGFYSGGLQLTNPTVSDGTRTLALGPGLLSQEYAELTLEGSDPQKLFLTHTYEDNYGTNNAWQYDVSQSLCSLSGGQVSVPAGGWFYYKFQGYPTKENIKLLATITKIGSPIIEYSTDGTIWYTALAATEIISGVRTEYYLTGTEKLSTIYIRFYSPVGSSMTVQDVSFSMLRDISAQYDQIPQIEPGNAGAITVISGSGSAKARIKTTFRARWYAQ